jgi:hypothetical protein
MTRITAAAHLNTHFHAQLKGNFSFLLSAVEPKLEVRRTAKWSSRLTRPSMNVRPAMTALRDEPLVVIRRLPTLFAASRLVGMGVTHQPSSHAPQSSVFRSKSRFKAAEDQSRKSLIVNVQKEVQSSSCPSNPLL